MLLMYYLPHVDCGVGALRGEEEDVNAGCAGDLDPCGEEDLGPDVLITPRNAGCWMEVTWPPGEGRGEGSGATKNRNKQNIKLDSFSSSCDRVPNL